MMIPATEYKGFMLRAYSKKVFPTHHDPYASGPKRFSSVVVIDTVPPSGAGSRRYSTVFSDGYPTRDSEAADLAMQYGKKIIDGQVHAQPL